MQRLRLPVHKDRTKIEQLLYKDRKNNITKKEQRQKQRQKQKRKQNLNTDAGDEMKWS